jgi:hypothetical protein
MAKCAGSISPVVNMIQRVEDPVPGGELLAQLDSV